MNLNGHTSACNESYTTYVKKLLEWEKKFPNYCRACGGRGYIIEESDMDWITSVKTCSCLENYICPRCGREIDYDRDNHAICKTCGYTDRNIFLLDVAPKYECECLDFVPDPDGDDGDVILRHIIEEESLLKEQDGVTDDDTMDDYDETGGY